MRYIIITIIAALSLSGCVSKALSIGHENFVCNGDTAGGKCMNTQTVYGQKEQIAISNKYSGDAVESDEKNVSATIIGSEENTPKYVYEPPKILKIRVTKYRNENGDLIDDTNIYVRTGDGYWKDENGNRIGRTGK